MKVQITVIMLLLVFNSFYELYSQPIKFAVVGDFGNGGQSEADIAGLINSLGVDFIVSVGDNYYGAVDANYVDSWNALDDDVGQYYSSWIGNLPANSNYLPGSPTNKFFPVPGNHDWYHQDGLDVYTDYFTLPGDGFVNTSGNERYYDFVWGNIHFFMLDNYGAGLNQYTFPRHGNSGEPDGVDQNSIQANWFYNQINNCVANHNHWRIVICHVPPYSSGSNHGSEPGVQWLYKAHGAHLVISGHDHIYERLVIDNLTYLVNGLGGNGTDAFGTTQTGSQFQYNSNYGAMLFTADGTTLTGKLYNTSGTMIDNFTITDSGLPVELVFFAAKLNGSNVELNWKTETEVNNFGFEIERALSSTTPRQDDWEKIGFVEGNGNSNSPKRYSYVDNEINQSGKYYYRLKQIDNDGTYEYSNISAVEVGVPNNYYLRQNYPNPFNPTTTIRYEIPVQDRNDKAFVTLKIYDVLGNKVATLVNGEKAAGSYSVTFNATNLPSGVYIYRLQTQSFAQNRKMTLLK